MPWVNIVTPVIVEMCPMTDVGRRSAGGDSEAVFNSALLLAKTVHIVMN